MKSCLLYYYQMCSKSSHLTLIFSYSLDLILVTDTLLNNKLRRQVAETKRSDDKYFFSDYKIIQTARLSEEGICTRNK